MNSIQSTLRGSLLTGASAVALSVSGYSANAQAVFDTSKWTFWVEGAVFQTGGGGMNVPSLSGTGFGSPFIPVGPAGGIEGAVGFDYSWFGPWHFDFDIRYGKSRTSTNGASSSSSSSFHSTTFKTFFSSHKSSSNSQTAWERESHLVTDFMIGHDWGLGTTTGQWQFGVRIADLTAKAWTQQNASSSSSFFSTYLGSDPSGSTTSTESAFGTFKSRFFGGGPRLAFTGITPINAKWSLDYAAGVAELFGVRSLSYNVTVTNNGVVGPILAGQYSNTAVIFNTDGWAALSYHFNPKLTLSSGVRADYYANVLTTYGANGSLVDVDRVYWGPFLRLTDKF